MKSLEKILHNKSRVQHLIDLKIAKLPYNCEKKGSKRNLDLWIVFINKIKVTKAMLNSTISGHISCQQLKQINATSFYLKTEHRDRLPSCGRISKSRNILRN